MEEPIISFEVAKLAKERRIDINTHNYYHLGYTVPYIKYSTIYRNQNAYKIRVSAPTQSLLQKYLRDKYKLHIDLWFNSLTLKWRIEGIYKLPEMEDFLHLDLELNTYELALEEGLLQGLKLIK